LSDFQQRIDTMVRRLKEMGCRITPQRMAILGILAESEGHPSAEDVYEKVGMNFPTTSMATVYKTISLLKSMGEVLELEFSGDFNRYDGNKPSPHPHLICTKCRRIIDPDFDGLADLMEKITSRTGYKIIGHRVDFYGLCPECQKSE